MTTRNQENMALLRALTRNLGYPDALSLQALADAVAPIKARNDAQLKPIIDAIEEFQAREHDNYMRYRVATQGGDD